MRVDASRAAALLFDLGGVVIDIDFTRAFDWWAAAAGADAAELGALFTFDERYEAHERGEISSADYFEHLRAELGLGLTDDELGAGWNDIYLGPTPGMADLLRGVGERWPLYALTNTNESHRAHWSVRYATELEVFREIFVSSELGVRKPDAVAFTEVAARIGVPPGEVLFFDDLVENVDGARAAGMPAVLVRSVADVGRVLTPADRD